MHHWFIPTSQNNFRAKLLQIPALIVLTIALFLGNTVVGFVPPTHVIAQVTTEDILDLHNQQRKEAGLPPLRLNLALNVSAQKKAQAMLDADCWSHYCPDNKSPWDFFADAGYAYIYAGENLAEGYFNNTDAMTAWMNSPTHRDNILRPEYEEMGVAIVRGNYQSIKNNVLIVVHFGTPQPKLASDVSGLDIFNNSLIQPKILQPTNNSFLSATEITINGTASDSNEIILKDGTETLASVDADQGIFTYKAKLPEKEYNITATGESGTRTSAASAAVKFTVDRTSDPIELKDISLRSLTNNMIQVAVTRPNLANAQLKLSAGWVDFSGPNLNIWSINIPQTLIEASTTISLHTEDKAGNVWEGDIDLKPFLENRTDLGTANSEIKQPAVTKAGFNVIFLIALAGLYLVDYIALRRTGATRTSSASHLHLGILLVTLIIVASGLLIAGSVGTGLAI